MEVPAFVAGGAGVASDHVSLELLDGFRLCAGTEQVQLSETAQRLVAFVALGGHPLRRPLVAGTLWPEKTESRASANLRSTLWRLNAAGPRPAIVCAGSALVLDPGVCVDIVALQRQGWALLDRTTGRVPELGTDWFSKELLPGWYDDWVILERERLGQLQIRFMEALVHHLRERGELARAIDQAMRLVALDPLRERSQLALIQALVAEGSWGRARWQAEQYCELLDGAFGVHASEAFMAAYRTLLPFEQALSP
jgi:DNA-binding SARP family transcriptional activator